MIVYDTYGVWDKDRTFATLAEAHHHARDNTEPVYRCEVRIRQYDIPTDKENLLRLVNSEGGTHIPTGRNWTLTSRGGLTELPLIPEADR